MFSGIHTAIITPFDGDDLNLEAFGALIEHQIDAGVQGIVVCGTTGESATVTVEEYERLFRAAAEAARGRCKVIGGVGSNNTRAAIELARLAAACRLDAGLCITPYYNKPTPEGLYRHFAAVAEAVPDLPLILYNVPGRTGVSLDVDTCARLAELPSVVALKEATGDLSFDATIISRVGTRMPLLSGDDATALPFWSVGGRGAISVASNLVPERMVALWRAWEGGQVAEARVRHLALLPLFRALFLETNPVPVKAMTAWRRGGFDPRVRLPLAPLTAAGEATLRALAETLEIELR